MVILIRLTWRYWKTKRNSEKDALINLDSVFLVDRLNIVADMFSIYQDAKIAKSLIKINFRGEDATGHGVSRDVYSQFYKEIFRFHSSGIHANVPSSLSETESELFGKILTHAYIQYNIFPIQIARAFFEQLLKGEVRNGTLIQSFKSYVQKNERESLERALKGGAVTEEETNSFWEMFIDCNVTIVPTTGNIREITLTAAKFVFVQKPFFALSKISKGLGSFWDEFSVSQNDLLWNLYKPTTANCLSYFNFDEAISPAEERIASFLKRFRSGASEEVLSLLLQFSTGAANLEAGSSIQVRFVNQPGNNLHITSATCFKISTLPKQFDSFKQFKTVIEGTLANPFL